jgi:poly-gamma-glutamate synthesis protein (capsule biosynthesis protein)
VTVSYVGFDGRAHRGTLVVGRRVAGDVAVVFRRLYAARFPIHRMQPIARYGGSDTRSMAADNTSAFNCRYRGGVCCTWSRHAYG